MTTGNRMRAVLIGVAATAVSACGADPDAVSPSAPSLFSVPVAQVSGQWTGTSTLRPGVSGIAGSSAECVGSDITARLANGPISEPVALTMAQTGSQVDGRLTSASGVACAYKGTASRDSLTMTSASCEAPPIVIRCTNGDVRDLELVGSSVSGALVLGSGPQAISGTVTNTYNMYVSGNERLGVGSVILNYSYAVNRQ